MELITQQINLASEIEGLDIRTSKFKTKRISLTFILPLTLKDTALASILSRLFTRSTGEYPTPISLQRKLLSLYGATFNSQVLKVGDSQLLNISTTVLSNEFSLQKEDLASQATELLCDAVFNPNCKNNIFPDEDITICKRLLIESLESIINDKRKYAISQMFSHMCQNEPFGIEIGGNVKTVESITNDEIFNYWQTILKTAPVIITVIGSDDPTPIYEQILSQFKKIERSPSAVSIPFDYKKPINTLEKKEELQLAQGKLVMGFRSSVSSLAQDNIALRMMCDIFGGAPYSKLFTIVREKMSLCYYCAARLQAQKGFICVDSGVDSVNIQATKDGILAQLSAIQQGDFDDDIIIASKMSLADSARSVTDSQGSLETWYLSRVFDHSTLSPTEFINNLEKITKEDIINAANTVTLDTVYTLQPMEEAE